MPVINIIAILLSPVIAVAITLWWQSRKEKRDAKLRLFLTLMAHRRAYPPTIEWVNSLNLIDVVFAADRDVVQLWHSYFVDLANPPTNQNFQVREHTYLQMLSAMARVLGYKHLEQTDIDKFYSPVAHGNQLETNFKIQQELLRVLQSTARIDVELKQPDAPPPPALPQ